MREVVVRQEGLRWDHVAAETMGTAYHGTVEALLAANPGLAALGPVLPVGTTVRVPEAPPRRRPVSIANPWE